MKIQIITHGLNDYNKTKKFGAWHSVAKNLDLQGHRIDFILKRDWPFIYWRYLKFRPDVIVITGVIGYYVLKLKKLGLIRCPVVLAWNDYFTEQMGRKWGISRIAKMEYYMVENADFITTPSKYLDSIAKILGKKSVYIPHGVDKDIYKIKSANIEGKFKIVYSGEISYYKRVNLLINAVKNKDVNLYLIGDVSNQDIIKNLPKNVKYIGFLTPLESLSYAKAADICVISSDQDSTLKMFEYLALGKPILAVNGRIAYVLKHGVNAYLADDLGEAISYLSKNKSLLKDMEDNNLKYKVYTWNEIAEKIALALKDVLKSYKR